MSSCCVTCPGLVMLSFCLCRHSTLRKTSCCVTVLVWSCCPSVCVHYVETDLMLCDCPGLVTVCVTLYVEKDLMLCDCPGLVRHSSLRKPHGHVVLLFVFFVEKTSCCVLSWSGCCPSRHSTLRKTSCCVTVLVWSCCPSVCGHSTLTSCCVTVLVWSCCLFV